MDDRDFIYFMNGALKFKPEEQALSGEQVDLIIENVCDVYKNIQTTGYINDFDSSRMISFIEGALMYYDEQPYEVKKKITSIIKNEVDEVMWRFERDSEDKIPFFTKEFETEKIKKDQKEENLLFDIEKQYNAIKEREREKKEEEEKNLQRAKDGYDWLRSILIDKFEEKTGQKILETENYASASFQESQESSRTYDKLIDWATSTIPSREKLQKVTFDIILENGGGFTVRQRAENESIDEKPLAVFTNRDVISAATEDTSEPRSPAWLLAQQRVDMVRSTVDSVGSMAADIKEMQKMGLLQKDPLFKKSPSSFLDEIQAELNKLKPIETSISKKESQNKDRINLDLEIFEGDNGLFFIKQNNLGNKLDNLLPSPTPLSDFYNEPFFKKEVHKKEGYEKLQQEIVKQLSQPITNYEQIETQEEVFEWFKKLNEKCKEKLFGKFENENNDDKNEKSNDHIFGMTEDVSTNIQEDNSSSLNSITENIVEKISESV